MTIHVLSEVCPGAGREGACRFLYIKLILLAMPGQVTRLNVGLGIGTMTSRRMVSAS